MSDVRTTGTPPPRRPPPAGAARRGRIGAGIGSAAATVGSLAAAIAVIGILGVHAGLLAPLTAFTLFAAGALLGGLLALFLGLLALLLTVGGPPRIGRQRAWLGTALGLVLLAGVLVGALPGRGLPRINDITTSPGDPPAFEAAARAPENTGRDMGYPPEFGPLAREAYPDLAPLELSVPPDAAFRAALESAEALGWEVTWRDPARGVFEAQDVSAVFRFVDDVRVRVRPTDGGSVVDVRSKSRDGRGDVGANAARIRRFARSLRARLAASG